MSDDGHTREFNCYLSLQLLTPIGPKPLALCKWQGLILVVPAGINREWTLL